VIRLWKIGNSKEGVLPTYEKMSKLLKYLEANKKGEIVDIVWDDMLKVEIFTDDGKIITA